MVFSTIIFLCVFLPLTIILYYLMPAKAKNYYLLIASLFFYAWGEPKFVFVMLASVVINYLLGLWIDTGKRKKTAVVLALLLNLGILFVFKYLTFSLSVIRHFITQVPLLEIALPIGISFYTFQGLSYVIDVYRGERAQKNPFYLALYIAMFPQLIAGPIVRYHEVQQAIVSRTHTVEKFAAGIRYFVIGLSKKAILANVTGEVANTIMTGDYTVMSCPVAWLGAIAYTLQIYFDFSGYSDMAIGLGKIFGFDFAANFNYPYISRSVSEFWRRWHISLSGWFRDYLYIPLGGNRTGNVYRNLGIVFLATGIWHGAAWGFVLWGIWHGAFVLAERYLGGKISRNKAIQKKTNQRKTMAGKCVSLVGYIVQWIYTMLVVVVGWVLFRIVDLQDFMRYVKIMFCPDSGFTAYGIRYYLSNQRIFCFVIALLACVPWRSVLGLKNRKFSPAMEAVVFVAERVFFLFLLIVSMVFVINSSYNPFIYFRF